MASPCANLLLGETDLIQVCVMLAKQLVDSHGTADDKLTTCYSIVCNSRTSGITNRNIGLVNYQDSETQNGNSRRGGI